MTHTSHWRCDRSSSKRQNVGEPILHIRGTASLDEAKRPRPVHRGKASWLLDIPHRPSRIGLAKNPAVETMLSKRQQRAPAAYRNSARKWKFPRSPGVIGKHSRGPHPNAEKLPSCGYVPSFGRRIKQRLQHVTGEDFAGKAHLRRSVTADSARGNALPLDGMKLRPREQRPGFHRHRLPEPIAARILLPGGVLLLLLSKRVSRAGRAVPSEQCGRPLESSQKSSGSVFLMIKLMASFSIFGR